jgi:predicted nucleotidyltransferase
MDKEELAGLISIFADYAEIKLVYFFGSKAEGKEGVLSDFDFAFYIDEKSPKKLYELKLSLIDRLSLLLKTDKVDVAILNLIDSPEMKYNIIKNGKLIFEREPFKVLIEPRILNEYFDFHSMLLRNNLTKA